MFFSDIFVHFVHLLSFIIGFFGIIIIFIGVIRALWSFGFRHQNCFPHARVLLGTHLVLGLDFFVGKDIIDTVLLQPKDITYLDLATLITVVAVRISLNHFLLKELREIYDEKKKGIKKSPHKNIF